MTSRFFRRCRGWFFRRVTAFYRKIALSRLPKELSAKPGQNRFRLVSFCGESGLAALSMTLYSVYRSFGELPVVRVVLDGSVDKQAARERLSFWPGELEIRTWMECVQNHRARGREALAVYAEKDVWGRKMAGILDAADDGAVLYSDSDVLWFADPSVPEPSESSMPMVRMSEDNLHCYHDEFLVETGHTGLLDDAPRNAGVIYLSGNIFEAGFQVTPLLEKISSAPHNRSEQTLFAILDRQFGDMWTRRQIWLTGEDNYRVFPSAPSYTKTAMARHYSGPAKCLFWRDGLSMICSS